MNRVTKSINEQIYQKRVWMNDKWTNIKQRVLMNYQCIIGLYLVVPAVTLIPGKVRTVLKKFNFFKNKEFLSQNFCDQTLISYFADLGINLILLQYPLVVNPCRDNHILHVGINHLSLNLKVDIEIKCSKFMIINTKVLASLPWRLDSGSIKKLLLTHLCPG